MPLRVARGRMAPFWSGKAGSRVLFALVLAASFSAWPTQAAAQETLTGTLTIVWDEGRPGSRDAVYYLTDARGTVTELEPGSGPASEDNLLARNGRRVRAQVRDRRARHGLPALSRLVSLETDAPAPALMTEAERNRDFVFLLCRFADIPSTPFTKEVVERAVGGQYPGMAHFFRELSEIPTMMSGNTVIDWVNLPEPRSGYVNDPSFTTNTFKLTRDCANAAAPFVDFSRYYGVAIQVNGDLARRSVPPNDILSYGGVTTLTINGEQHVFGAAWFSVIHIPRLSEFPQQPGIGNWRVYAHELGHGLGWGHTGGRYGNEYGSRWDMMSGGGAPSSDGTGPLPIHTIMFHKHRSGWVSEARVLKSTRGSTVSGFIARSALGGPNDYRMAMITVNDTTEYIVEARMLAGYDALLPGEGILIHELNRHVPGSPSHRVRVLDIDNNGDQNDEGAVRRVGQIFSDPANALQLIVESQNAAGAFIRIIRGGIPFTIASEADRRVGAVGFLYADTIRASGASSIFWNLEGGSLPPGVALNPQTGRIAGTPTQAGLFDFRLTGHWGTESASRDFNVRIHEKMAIESDSIRGERPQGVAFTDTLRASGGTGTYSWHLAVSPLPPGIQLDGSTGVLSGTPTTAGTFRFYAEARSLVPPSIMYANRQFRIDITENIAILSDSIRPAGTMGASHADTLRALGGTESASWVITDGSLPAGLALDGQTGVISGIPAAPGSSEFVVRASSGSVSATRGFAINVVRPVLTVERVLGHILGAILLTDDEARYLDMVGNNNGALDIGDIQAWLKDSGLLPAQPGAGVRNAPDSGVAARELEQPETK